MEKQIKSKDNIIRIVTDQGYCSKSVHITKAFFRDKDLEKTITFSIWDDMSFRTYIHNQDVYSGIMELSFDIDIDDQIYFALNRMLGKDNSLIIDDDTREELKNYVEFKRDVNKILVIFYDEDINKPLFERFNVFIKNIASDFRSKIEDFNIKYRLVRFFREAEEILLNEYHQFTLDECFEILKHQGVYQGPNPFLSKTNRWFKNPCESCYNCLVECNEEKSMEHWCENYIPDTKNYYTNLLKNKKDNEYCATCEYSLSPEIVESIINESSEYRDLTLEEAETRIGYCEFYETIDIPRKLGYWCPSYMSKEKQGPVLNKTRK